MNFFKERWLLLKQTAPFFFFHFEIWRFVGIQTYVGIRNHLFSSYLVVRVCSVLSSLCDPLNCSPARLFCPWIFHARILEWVAIPFSGGSFQPRDGTCVSCISCIGSQILYHFSHLGSPLGIYVCIYTYLLAAQGSMWDLSSLTRDQTHTPSSGSTESWPLDLQGSSKQVILR